MVKSFSCSNSEPELAAQLAYFQLEPYHQLWERLWTLKVGENGSHPQ